jgi:hypothetical protein
VTLEPRQQLADLTSLPYSLPPGRRDAATIQFRGNGSQGRYATLPKFLDDRNQIEGSRERPCRTYLRMTSRAFAPRSSASPMPDGLTVTIMPSALESSYAARLS